MKSDKLSPEEVEDVYLQYRKDIWHFLLSLCRNRDEAADLFQGVFLKITEKASEGYIVRDKIKPFLFRLTYNHFVDSRRTKKVVFGAEKLAESQSSPHDDLSYAIHDLINTVVDGRDLPERCRTILRLRLIGGYSVSDIARHMSISRPTVYADLQQGMEHLQKEFEKIGITPDVIH